MKKLLGVLILMAISTMSIADGVTKENRVDWEWDTHGNCPFLYGLC